MSTADALDDAQSDPEHHVSDERGNGTRRAMCSCGWRGAWRRGRSAGWNAISDGDDHYNECADTSWMREIEHPEEDTGG